MDFYALTTNRDLPTNDITITGDTLTINIVDSTMANIFGNTGTNDSFSLSSLVTDYAQDHGCIAIIPQGMQANARMMIIETTQLSYPERAAPGDSYTSYQTTPGKNYAGSPYSVIDSRYRSYGYVYILTPTATCSVDDCTVIYRAANANVVMNGSTISPIDTIESTHAFLHNWLPITITGAATITAGSTATYTVTGTANTTVYLSTDIGVINRSRVTESKTFQLDTTGLEAGETVTIKAGYKYWSGVTKMVITLE